MFLSLAMSSKSSWGTSRCSYARWDLSVFWVSPVVSRRDPLQMPEPSHLAPLHSKEQQLHSELFPEVQILTPSCNQSLLPSSIYLRPKSELKLNAKNDLRVITCKQVLRLDRGRWRCSLVNWFSLRFVLFWPLGANFPHFTRVPLSQDPFIQFVFSLMVQVQMLVLWSCRQLQCRWPEATVLLLAWLMANG